MEQTVSGSIEPYSRAPSGVGLPFLCLGRHARYEYLALRPLLPQARAGSGIDALVWLQLEDRRQPLACAVRAHGQPRHVRLALWELTHAIRRICPDSIPLLIAPFLSPASQAICKEDQVAFLDHQGNARLVFDGIFIERVAAGQPAAVRRDLKNLFSPKAGQVLRVLLRDPWRPWRVTELAQTAEVSLGCIP